MDAPAITYSTQPPHSRLSRETVDGQIVYAMPSYDLPFLNRWSLIYSIRRSWRPLTIVLAGCFLFWLYRYPSGGSFVDHLLTSATIAAAAFVMEYIELWWYWRRGIRIAIDDHRIAVCDRIVYWNRSRSVPRSRVCMIRRSGPMIRLLDGHGIAIMNISGPYTLACAWLAVQLRNDLDLEWASGRQAWMGELRFIRRLLRKALLRLRATTVTG